MPVQQDIHLDSAVLGMYQGIDDAVSVLAEEVANQEKRQFDRMPGVVDFRQDGLVRSVVLAFKQGVPAKGVEQIEVTLRVDSISLNLFSSVDRSQIAANLRLTGISGQTGGSPNG